jgi:hypothetical protein
MRNNTSARLPFVLGRRSPRPPKALQGKMNEKIEKARMKMTDDLTQIEKGLILVHLPKRVQKKKR